MLRFGSLVFLLYQLFEVYHNHFTGRVSHSKVWFCQYFRYFRFVGTRFRSSHVMASSFVFQVCFGNMGHFVFTGPGRPRLPKQEGGTPTTIVPIGGVRGTPLTIVMRRFVFVVGGNGLASVKYLRVSTTNVVIYVDAVGAVRSISRLRFRVRHVHHDQMYRVRGFNISQRVLGQHVQFVNHSFQVVPYRDRVPTSTLPVGKVRNRGHRVAIERPFGRECTLSFRVRFLQHIRAI